MPEVVNTDGGTRPERTPRGSVAEVATLWMMARLVRKTKSPPGHSPPTLSLSSDLLLPAAVAAPERQLG